MNNIDWIGFVVASVAVVLAPGPGSLFVARTAGTSGPRAGYASMAGIMVGDACLIVLSVLGMSALFRTYPSVFHIFRLAGAGYLIILGLRLVLNRAKVEATHVLDCNRSFVQAVSITLLNPEAIFFFMAFFPVFVRLPEHSSFLSYTAMALVFQLISMTYLTVLIRVSSWTASALRKSSVARVMLERLCGCAFIYFGLKVVLNRK